MESVIVSPLVGKAVSRTLVRRKVSVRSRGGRLLFARLLLLLGAVGGCGDTAEFTTEHLQRNAVKVKLQGPLATIDTLRLSVSVDGRPSKKLEDIDVKSEFALVLPDDTTGRLTVQIDGINSQRWIVASGSGIVDVAPDQVERLTVILKRQGEVCRDGWCYQGPVPRPDTIQALWAFNDKPAWQTTPAPKNNPVWALGNRGLFQQWDGDVWRELPVISGLENRQLTSIAMSASDDIWVAAPNPASYSFNGAGWTNRSGTLRKIWSAGPNDVWGITKDTISHWDGLHWANKKPAGIVPAAEFYGVGGTGPNDVWVVGNVVLRDTGSGLTPLTPSTNGATMHAVWRDPKTGTVWMAGRADQAVPMGPFYGPIFRGESPYMMAWESVATPFDFTIWLYDISGIDGKDIWVVGEKGSMAHWNGAQWLQVHSGVAATLRTISIRSSDDVWFGGDGGTVLHWNGSAIELKAGGLPNFQGIWGTASDNLWAVGSGGAIYHYDGQTWSAVQTGFSDDFSSIWGSSDKDIWVVGKDTLGKLVTVHWKNGKWSRSSTPTQETGGAHPSVWGTSAQNVFATLAGGKYLNFDGTQWSYPKSVNLPLDTDLVSIDGFSDQDIWALGVTAAGLGVARYDGLSWTDVSSSIPGLMVSANYLAQIRVFSAQEVWIAVAPDYRRSLVYRWNNTSGTWEAKDWPSPPGSGPVGVIGGSAPNDIWFGGFQNSLARWTGSALELKYNGSDGQEFDVQHPLGIRSIFTLSPGMSWAVGDGGLIMKTQ